MEEQLTARDKRLKVMYEGLDLLLGALLPFIMMCIISSMIIMFAAMDDLVISLVAVIGGDAFLIAAFVAFGRQNGATAYRRFYLNETKRKLGNKEKKVVFGTGEYALWKAFVIPVIACVPFIIFQIVNIIWPNTFCEFILQYACGWAYYPFKMAGLHEALNLIFIIVPVISHAAGYVSGMRKEERIQARIAEESAKLKKKKKK